MRLGIIIPIRVKIRTRQEKERIREGQRIYKAIRKEKARLKKLGVPDYELQAAWNVLHNRTNGRNYH